MGNGENPFERNKGSSEVELRPCSVASQDFLFDCGDYLLKRIKASSFTENKRQDGTIYKAMLVLHIRRQILPVDSQIKT